MTAMLEVEQAIRRLASNEAVGPDELPAEFTTLFPVGNEVHLRLHNEK